MIVSALEQIRSRISEFPGYSDEADRRHSDSLVRSYLGEAIATLRSRMSSAEPALLERVDALVLRAGFANQAVIKVFEYAVLDGARVDEVASRDVSILDLADRAPEIESATLGAYLDSANGAFDARDTAMRGSSHKTTG
jgi:hypothetical protein